MGEDRATYRREGGPGGADKRGEAGAGSTQSFQFVRVMFVCNQILSDVALVPSLLKLTRRPASADRTARGQFQAGLRGDIGL